MGTPFWLKMIGMALDAGILWGAIIEYRGGHFFWAAAMVAAAMRPWSWDKK